MGDMYDDGGSVAQDIAEAVITAKVLNDLSDTVYDPSCSTVDNTAGWNRIRKRSETGLTGIISAFVRVATAIWIVAMIAALIYCAVTGA